MVYLSDRIGSVRLQSWTELLRSTAPQREDYVRIFLVLLSICETCRNRGIDFLDFLRSGERDVEAFTKSKRPKAANTYQTES